jgi:hypothetical protein
MNHPNEHSNWPTLIDNLHIVLAGPSHKSEDLVRYAFFESLRSSGVELGHFSFEHPHSTVPRAKVDTVLVDPMGQPTMALEVKYHRANPSGMNLPRPQLAGMFIHDLARLAAFPGDIERLALYVTDDEMASYLTNPDNGLTWIMNLQPGQTTNLTTQDIAQRSATFQKAVGDWPDQVTITCRHTADNIAGHWVRVFNVGSPLKIAAC